MKCELSFKNWKNVTKIYFDANFLFDESYSLNEQDHFKSILTLLEKELLFIFLQCIYFYLLLFFFCSSLYQRIDLFLWPRHCNHLLKFKGLVHWINYKKSENNKNNSTIKPSGTCFGSNWCYQCLDRQKLVEK
jgi:hypothetical protein